MFGTSFNSHFVIELSLALVLVGAILTGHSQNLVSYRYEKLGLNKHRLKHIPLITNMISVSGHSSGAGATTNFYLSNSEQIDGIALFSSMPYQCGGGGGLYNLVPCLRGRGNTSESIQTAEKYAAAGLIDPLSNLVEKRHYIFHGTQDTFIHFETFYSYFADNGLKVHEFFKTFSKHVKFEQYDALHSIPSKTCGITCTGIPRQPGTGCSKCSFSVVFDGLNFIYKGELVESTATTCRPKYNNDGLTLVDQSEFMSPMDAKVSMLPDAVLYTPPQCRVNSTICRLHIAYHGCRHSIQNDGMDYIKCSGYLETADANNFIVLFPQVKQSSVTAITFLLCWDMYGYSGPLYGTKMGSQNQVVERMLSRIMNKDENEDETQELEPVVVTPSNSGWGWLDFKSNPSEPK